MKTRTITLAIFMITSIIMNYAIPAYAQTDSTGYITVTGIVKDKQSRKALSSVNISVPGTNIGTVTNEDGVFSLKLKEKRHSPVMEISHLGYRNQRINIDSDNREPITVLLIPHTNLINEIVVLGVNPLLLVQEALKNVSNNYINSPSLLTGFYRETGQKGKKYINVSEAVVNIYKTSYAKSIDDDKVRILKGRRLLSQKASDTLGVKLMGGPTLGVYADIAKNRDAFINPDGLNLYNFRMEESVNINNTPQYVVSFTPKVELPDEALFSGKIYIDKDHLTFSRIEFALDMSSKYKATKAILYKKPLGLRFNPQEMSYVVTYKLDNGKAVLNYIRNNIRFKCDWKRRLFARTYSVVSEMVITDLTTNNVIPIRQRDSFDREDAFYDKVASFENDNFWEDYNIIEPSESLEHAVFKLKKQNR